MLPCVGSADVHVAILGAIDLEIEMTCIGCLVSFHTGELYIFTLIISSETCYNKNGKENTIKRSFHISISIIQR